MPAKLTLKQKEERMAVYKKVIADLELELAIGVTDEEDARKRIKKLKGKLSNLKNPDYGKNKWRDLDPEKVRESRKIEYWKNKAKGCRWNPQHPDFNRHNQLNLLLKEHSEALYQELTSPSLNIPSPPIQQRDRPKDRAIKEL